MDHWHGCTNLHFRCAIAVKGVSKQEEFGVAEVDAFTITDHGARIVALIKICAMNGRIWGVSGFARIKSRFVLRQPVETSQGAFCAESPSGELCFGATLMVSRWTRAAVSNLEGIMKAGFNRNAVVLGFGLLLPLFAPFAAAQPADPGWPRVFKKGGQQLTVYQPQVDFWHGYTNLHFRCAIAVKGVLKDEKFGVAEVDALTVTDHGARVVAIVPLRREFRFAGVAEPDLTRLRQAVEVLNPPGQATTLSLDRVIAYLDPARQPVQHPVELNLAPPRIFSSTTPAILVNFMGEPRMVPVETNRTDLLFALNTNWDVLYDTASRQYFLLNGEGWLSAPDVRKGPWTPVYKLPPSFSSLPANDNWAEARKRLPGQPARTAPTVFVTTEPAEMILTEGVPSYMPVRGTALLHVNNTASTLFLHTGDGKLYFLVAGRWFRGGSLNGPWSAASGDLPADFARIPDADPLAWVKASVPGTREAKDAVLLASIPTTTTINITNTVNVNVVYSGAPQFIVITNTVVQYAVNTPNQVFLVSGGYYCCAQGMWFCGASPSGPWIYCTSVPSAIYTIPPSNPNYNVTYVVVQSSTPTTVVYSQTSGYSGEYVAKTGVLMFGMGLLVGAAIANNNDCDYCYYPPPPCHYSYGCGATYHYGYGGYYGASYSAYGPYGGASYTAGYNPSTGTYGRSATAYGAYGSATRSAAYNPYTGTAAAGGSVNTAYGSASRGATYNASTGTSTAGRQMSNAYGTASQGAAYNAQTGARAAGGTATTSQGTVSRGAAYNPTTGEGAAARSASGQYGSAGTVTTTSGSSAAAWDTQQGQGAVGKSSSGDVYASNGDTVYKKDSEGNWSQNSGSGWETTESPQQQAQAQASSKQQQAQTQATSAQSQAQTQASTAQSQAQTKSSSAQASGYQQQAQAKAASTQSQAQTGASSASSSWSQQKSSMESQAQSRQSGNQQAARTSQYQSSGGSHSWSGSSSRSSAASGGRSSGGRR